MMKRFNYYNGTKHNHDSKRPTIGAACFKLTKDFKVIDNKEYQLINILVHDGKYDSYAIKNMETGKMSTVKAIAIEMVTTEYKGKYFFLNQSAKFDRDFKTVKAILDKNPETITSDDKIKLLSIYSIAYHESGKIEGISSADSTATGCKFCQDMRKAHENDNDCICNYCYDVKQETFKSVHVVNRHTLNLLIMSTVEFTETELKHVHGITDIFRVNSSGDIENTTHAGNMLKLIKGNPFTHAAIWSKNVVAVVAAVKKYGKPENCILIQSDYTIDGTQVKNPYFDYIFRVFRKTTIAAAIESGMSVCNGNNCRDCGFKCYFGTHENDNIAEVLRS